MTHRLVILPSNSPHIGEECPVRHTPFQPGDAIIVCQPPGRGETLVSLESVSFLDGYCPICGEYVDIPLSSTSVDYVDEDRDKEKPDIPPERGRKWGGVVLIVALLVGVSLGALGIWILASSRYNDASPTRLIPTVAESKPASSFTVIPTSRPDPTTKPLTATRDDDATRTPRSEPTESVSRAEIEDLLERWDQVHHHADRHWDTNDLDTVLRGDALNQQRSTVRSLESRNCYWIIHDLAEPHITRFDVRDSDQVIVEVDKSWDMDLYCDGNKSGDDDGPFTMWYSIERINGQWYITQKRVIDN